MRILVTEPLDPAGIALLEERQFTVDLDAAIAAHGLSYNSTFKIRFNQFDNYGITTDGIAIDDILITANPLGVPVTLTMPAQAVEGTPGLSATITRTIKKDGSVDVKRVSSNGKVTIDLNNIYDMAGATRDATPSTAVATDGLSGARSRK